METGHFKPTFADLKIPEIPFPVIRNEPRRRPLPFPWRIRAETSGRPVSVVRPGAGGVETATGMIWPGFSGSPPEKTAAIRSDGRLAISPGSRRGIGDTPTVASRTPAAVGDRNDRTLPSIRTEAGMTDGTGNGWTDRPTGTSPSVSGAAGRTPIPGPVKAVEARRPAPQATRNLARCGAEGSVNRATLPEPSVTIVIETVTERRKGDPVRPGRRHGDRKPRMAGYMANPPTAHRTG